MNSISSSATLRNCGVRVSGAQIHGRGGSLSYQHTAQQHCGALGCRNQRPKGPFNEWVKDATCHWCNEMGHVAPKCPAKKLGKPRKSPKPPIRGQERHPGSCFCAKVSLISDHFANEESADNSGATADAKDSVEEDVSVDKDTAK